MTKPWLVKVGVLFIKKRGCIVLTHPHIYGLWQKKVYTLFYFFIFRRSYNRDGLENELMSNDKTIRRCESTARYLLNFTQTLMVMKTLIKNMRNIFALATMAMICITATARPIYHRTACPHRMCTTIVVAKAGTPCTYKKHGRKHCKKHCKKHRTRCICRVCVHK